MAEGDNIPQQRYCGNCGNRLVPEDRFCGNCGTPVHRTARVPTPEADVPIPPPPQQQQQAREAGARSKTRGPGLALLGILLLLGVVETAQGMSEYRGGEGFSFQLGYGMGGAAAVVLIAAVIALVVGGVVYLVASVRGSEVTLLEAIFSWPVVVVVGVISFFILV